MGEREGFGEYKENSNRFWGESKYRSKKIREVRK